MRFLRALLAASLVSLLIPACGGGRIGSARSACEAGDRLKCAEVGDYEHRRGHAKDAAIAFKEACRLGRAESCLYIGGAMARRELPGGMQEAAVYYGRACALGRTEACPAQGPAAGTQLPTYTPEPETPPIEQVAHGEVSDSEKSAARQLYADGVKLESTKSYDAALEKFQRAQRVIAAPTNLLRIAACQAQLGRLVEASETYRAAMRAPAQQNAAFVNAEEQARKELDELTPRIPRLTVAVAPANAPRLAMSIDGRSIATAVIGVPLPLDPGTHKIVVSASGFVPSEKSVALKERDATSITVTLRRAGTVAVTDRAAR